MPKPTQAEVATLVADLRMYGVTGRELEAADAIEALAGEGAEVHIDYPILASTTQEAMGAAPPAKPTGELPPLPEPTQGLGVHLCTYSADDMHTYALRALRERA